MKILYGCDQGVANWVANQLFDTSAEYFGPCAALGVVDRERMLAGFVYNNYRTMPNGKPLSIELSVASVDKRWMTRHTIRAMFAYPFTQLKLRRMQALTSIHDEGTNSIMKRLGFNHEGTHPKALPQGDAISWGMLRKDCGWL